MSPATGETSLLNKELQSLFSQLLIRKDDIADRWIAQHGAVFPVDRKDQNNLERVLRALTSQLLSDLAEADADSFANSLKRCARLFYNMGVAFEEVILSIHLFQEACMGEMIASSILDQDNLPSAKIDLDRIGRAGLQVVSAFYFDSYRTQMNYEVSHHAHENQKIRSELSSLKEQIQEQSRESISGIQTTVSDISRKLRRDAVLQKTIFRLTLALDKARNEEEIINVGLKFFSSILPADCEVVLLIHQESVSDRYLVYRRSKDGDSRAELADEITAEELSDEFRAAEFNVNGTPVVKTGFSGPVPQHVFSLSRLTELSEYALLPVARFGELIGLFWIAYPRKGLLQGKSSKHLKRFVRIIAAALSSARYFDYYKAKQKAYVAISSSGRLLSASRSLHQILDGYLGALLEMTSAERVSVMLPDASGSSLMVAAAKGYRVYPFSGTSFKSGEGICGTAFKEGRSFCINHLRNELPKKELPVKSLACMPVFSEDKVIAVVNLSAIRKIIRFDPPIVEAAQALAEKMAPSLAELRLL